MDFSSSKQFFLRFYAYMYLYTGGVVTRGLKISLIAVADPGEGPRPPPLFLDQNEVQMAKKNFWRPPHPSSLSGGLDAPLDSICNI